MDESIAVQAETQPPYRYILIGDNKTVTFERKDGGPISGFTIDRVLPLLSLTDGALKVILDQDSMTWETV